MANEALVWKRFKRLMQGERVTHLERVEPILPKGLPDIDYVMLDVSDRPVAGWIELKDVDDWPKREKTPLRIPHFKKEQRLWLWHYGQRRGQAFILVHVKDICFLFDWKAAYSLGELTRTQMFKYASLSWADNESIAWRDAIISRLTRVTNCGWGYIPDCFRGPTIIHL